MTVNDSREHGRQVVLFFCCQYARIRTEWDAGARLLFICGKIHPNTDEPIEALQGQIEIFIKGCFYIIHMLFVGLLII